MLVLSRRESQRIKLGDSIVVTVVRVAGDCVRLGIEAPSDVLVLRSELDVGSKERNSRVAGTQISVGAGEDLTATGPAGSISLPSTSPVPLP